MEISVQIIGIILRILDFVLAPLFWLAGRGRGGSVPRDDNPILNYGVVELADKIRSGLLTSEEVVSTYIKRIKFVDCFVNAVVEDRFDAAIEDARNVDRLLEKARRTGDWNGISKDDKPLLGVPCTVKESCSLESLSNAVGCLENAGSKATQDGEVVALIKKAGAIPLLVSNTPEYCLGWESTNLLNGTTHNPYKLNMTAGGSSGGEGALLGCGASPFGVASDIAGSIRVPSAFCGVYGHKPTPGLISIVGHIPYLTAEQYPRFLAIGPMARRASDLPLLLKVMAGENADKFQFDKEVDFRDLNVFYMTEASDSIALMKTDKKVKECIINAAHYLRDKCGSKISEKKFTALEDSVDISISLFFSMKDIPNMLQDPNNPKREKSLFVELIKYMLGCGSRSLQGLGFAFINKTKLFIPESRRAYYHKKADELKEDLIRNLGTNGVLLYPTWPCAAHQPHRVFPRAAGVVYTMVGNVMGLPATATPAAPGPLPLSVQIIAAPNQDHLCIAVAKKLEEAFGGWKPPQ